MAKVKPALAIAEAERIHRLVKKLNAVVERAAECGLGTNLTVTGGSPESRARLDVRTTLWLGDLLDTGRTKRRSGSPAVPAMRLSAMDNS